LRRAILNHKMDLTHLFLMYAAVKICATLINPKYNFYILIYDAKTQVKLRVNMAVSSFMSAVPDVQIW